LHCTGTLWNNPCAPTRVSSYPLDSPSARLRRRARTLILQSTCDESYESHFNLGGHNPSERALLRVSPFGSAGLRIAALAVILPSYRYVQSSATLATHVACTRAILTLCCCAGRLELVARVRPGSTSLNVVFCDSDMCKSFHLGFPARTAHSAGGLGCP
jgi:hypothetical protein